MLYKQILESVCSYGVELKSNREIMFSIVHNNAPWYIGNDGVHKDLKITSVTKTVQQFARKH